MLDMEPLLLDGCLAADRGIANLAVGQSIQPDSIWSIVLIIQRSLTAAILDALKDTPVVCLLGPRQRGKSTLAMHLDSYGPYFE